MKSATDEALSRARANTATAEENRARMQWVTAQVDATRETFGFGVRVIYACENGIEKGRPGPVGIVAELPTRLRPLRI